MSFQSKSLVLAASFVLLLVSATDAYSETHERAVTRHWKLGRTGLLLSSWQYPGYQDLIDGGYPMWYSGFTSIPFGHVNAWAIRENFGAGLKSHGCIWIYAFALPGVWYVPFNIQGISKQDSIVVTVTLTNDSPVASSFSIPAAGSGASTLMVDLLANAADPNGDPIGFSSLTQPSPAGCGSVIWNSQTNLAEFTPLNDRAGLCQFSYTVTDIASVSSPGTVSVAVTN